MITALRPDPDQAAVMERSGFYLCPNNGKDPCCQLGNRIVMEAYAKLSLKKYRPIAARNEDAKVSSGLR